MSADELDLIPIRQILKDNKRRIKIGLRACAQCGLCAESCFKYVASGNPKHTPSYKFLHSIGRLYRRKGRVSRREMIQIRDMVWHDCVLCTRCYCPFGIDIPALITLSRRVCRSQGLFRHYDHEPRASSEQSLPSRD